jgi:anti-sigma factor RsiW
MSPRNGSGTQRDTEPAEAHTLIGAYALDALDDLERATFERHLAACAPCREELAGLRSTAVRLADAAAVPPPQRVREQVLAQTRVTPQVRTAPTPAAPERAVRTTGRRLWLAAAAVLAVVSVGTGVTAWNEHEAARRAQADAQRITGVLTDPAARQVQAPVAGGGRATLVVAGDRAVLAGGGLPALPADRTYQLWIIRGEEITSAGLGPQGADAAGAWSRPVDGVGPGDLVALSVEPTGGSAQPTTTPVVALKV